MSINMSLLTQMGAGLIAFGGIVYEIGRHSQKLGDLIPEVLALEKKIDNHSSNMYDVHGKLSSIEERIIHMEKEVLYIRDKLDK